MKRTALFLVLALIFLEWLDFSLYLYLAKSVFAVQFFPDSSASVILSFALFATAYFARPVGGWLFGVRADSKGRRVPMIVSAALMGVATLGLCLLPAYAQIGVAATWGLLGLRIAQGLALGGEINTSAMFLVESNPQRPLFTGSLVAMSCALGMFIGGSFATLLSYFSLMDGWRFVFAAAGLLSLWVCRLRKQLGESAEFIAAETAKSTPVNWLAHRRGMVNIFTLGIYVSVTVYLCNIFWVSYATDCQLWSRTSCIAIGSLAQLLSALLAVLIGRRAHAVDVYRLLQASMLVLIVTAPLLFYATTQLNTPAVLVSLLGYIAGNGLLSAALFYFLYLQLPVTLRCRGVSTIWAIAASLGASTLPLSAHLVSRGAVWFPGALVSILAATSLLFCREMRSSRRGNELIYS